MHDLLPVLHAWAQRSETFALATVIHTSGSSPRPVGSILAVNAQGNSIGSVSAGCVEGYVIERCTEVIQSLKAEVCSFGASLDGNDRLWDIGLSCQGKMDILITPVKSHDHAFRDWLARIESGEAAIYWQPLPDSEAAPDVSTSPDHLSHETHFPLINPSPDKLLIFGANHIAAPLISCAKILGMSTYLIDPRDAFTSEERFPDPPHFLFKQWPQQCQSSLPLNPRSYAVLLSHDPKLDLDALAFLLKSDVAYIGALGSRSTQQQRRAELDANGFTQQEINKIHGPVGIDIGAQTPPEIAASILSQIISVKRGGPKWK